MRAVLRWLATPRGAAVLFTLLLAAEKSLLSWSTHDFSIDGGFFVDVAQNVRDGNGLATDVSMYHLGYPSLPHATSVYPLWPLLLGYTARLVPIELVAVWLPTLFYFAALGLGWLWARALFPTPEGLLGQRWLDSGLVFVVVLGTNRAFFSFTSMPYTEALALALLAGALWRSVTRLRSPSAGGGIELGLWAAAGFLARSQLAVFSIALLVVLLAAAVASEGRRDYWKMSAACVVTWVACIAPHFVYMAAFLPRAGLNAYINFEQARVTELLTPFLPHVRSSTIADALVARWRGVIVSLTPGASQSYGHTFYAFIYAAPVALVLASGRAVAGCRSDCSRHLAWLRSREALPWLLAVVFSVGAAVSLHDIHKNYNTEWPFARRYALVLVFAVVLALVSLLRHRQRWLRLVGALLLVAGTAQGLSTIHLTARRAYKASLEPQPRERERAELVAWINQERAARGALTLAVSDNEAQQLAWRTPGVGYHWIHNLTTPADLQTLLRSFGVQYVILRAAAPGEERATAGRPPQLVPELVQGGAQIDGFGIYAAPQLPDTSAAGQPGATP